MHFFLRGPQWYNHQFQQVNIYFCSTFKHLHMFISTWVDLIYCLLQFTNSSGDHGKIALSMVWGGEPKTKQRTGSVLHVCFAHSALSTYLPAGQLTSNMRSWWLLLVILPLCCFWEWCFFLSKKQHLVGAKSQQSEHGISAWIMAT